MNDFVIPQQLARNNIDVYGQQGTEWVEKLPAIIEECARRWSLEVDAPFPGLSYNYAAPARRADGTPAVLKVGFPSRELKTEIEALRVYDGRGVVQLYEADFAVGAMLLEHIRPGTQLRTLQDDQQATSIAAEVMRKLWQPAPEVHSFPSVADWAGRGMRLLREQFGGTTGPFPERLVVMAERLFNELLDTMEPSVILHGDLQHYNILAAERQPWLAIDPKGVVGEPAYEVGALLRNPSPHVYEWPDLQQTLERRVDQLSEELGFSKERIKGWGIAQAVLSAWWTYEDHGIVGEGAMRIAALLAGDE
jgi:streptomycin 6-kinase